MSAPVQPAQSTPTEALSAVPAPAVVPKTEVAPEVTENGTAPVPANSRKNRRRTSKPKTTESPSVEDEEDNKTKIFVGNLAFATTEEELKAFGASCGEVVKVEIIFRGPRSLGYGFVSYNTEAEALKAVAELDKKELGARPVNVENVKVRVSGEPRPARTTSGRGRGKGRGRGRGGRSGDKRVDDVDGEATPAGETEGEDGGAGRGKKTRAPRRPRKAEGESPELSGELSETGLFVANLPFKVTDDDLKAIFKDYKVAKARVVRLPHGRSKGFGFVEVETQAEQEKIMTELKNVVVEGRELVIKVAYAHQTAPSDEEAVVAEPAA